jgi:hypothetical protein
MKSMEPPARLNQEEWRNLEYADTLPALSTRVPIPAPIGHDSSVTSLQENDPTRTFLHQMSQTLTSLRGTLELALLVDCDAQGYRGAIQQSLVQAERLVQLFKSYRASAQGGNGWSGESA